MRVRVCVRVRVYAQMSAVLGMCRLLLRAHGVVGDDAAVSRTRCPSTYRPRDTTRHDTHDTPHARALTGQSACRQTSRTD
jgi:hypothetical protein